MLDPALFPTKIALFSRYLLTRDEEEEDEQPLFLILHCPPFFPSMSVEEAGEEAAATSVSRGPRTRKKTQGNKRQNSEQILTATGPLSQKLGREHIMGADGLDPLSRILKGDGGKREIEIGGGGTGEEEGGGGERFSKFHGREYGSFVRSNLFFLGKSGLSVTP